MRRYGGLLEENEALALPTVKDGSANLAQQEASFAPWENRLEPKCEYDRGENGTQHFDVEMTPRKKKEMTSHETLRRQICTRTETKNGPNILSKNAGWN